MTYFRGPVALALILVLGFAAQVSADPFTPGNVVVYRVGDKEGGTLVSSGNAVVLDEYTSAGTLVQSFAISSSGSDQLTARGAAGNAASEGLLTQSTNNQYLLLTGYDASPGNINNGVARVIGRVEVATGTYTRTNALTDFATGNNNPRSVTSDDGTRFWVTGSSSGVRYVANVGDTSSTQLSTTVTDLRQVNIFNGQLYVSTGSGSSVRLGTVGTGLPTTSGQTITNLPGFSTSGSPYGFFLADLDANVAGVDTLYVADDGASGVTKYSLVNNVWTANGSIGADADDYRGLTAVANGSTVTLFATRKGGSGPTGGGELVTLVDTTGYNGNFSGSFTTLTTAGAGTAFRGVVYIAAIPEPGSLALGGVVLLLGCGACFARKRHQ